jgi:hypothetical protein
MRMRSYIIDIASACISLRYNKIAIINSNKGNCALPFIHGISADKGLFTGIIYTNTTTKSIANSTSDKSLLQKKKEKQKNRIL